MMHSSRIIAAEFPYSGVSIICGGRVLEASVGRVGVEEESLSSLICVRYPYTMKVTETIRKCRTAGYDSTVEYTELGVSLCLA